MLHQPTFLISHFCGEMLLGKGLTWRYCLTVRPEDGYVWHKHISDGVNSQRCKKTLLVKVWLWSALWRPLYSPSWTLNRTGLVRGQVSTGLPHCNHPFQKQNKTAQSWSFWAKLLTINFSVHLSSALSNITMNQNRGRNMRQQKTENLSLKRYGKIVVKDIMTPNHFW